MTIHITDISNESFNHPKHVLHVDNEFALIEINKDNIRIYQNSTILTKQKYLHYILL